MINGYKTSSSSSAFIKLLARELIKCLGEPCDKYLAGDHFSV